MNPENKICQNCKKEFTVEPEDFNFYKKINVPAPTFCPDCRFQRRLMFWNPLTLYRRPCDLCKNFSVSAYPPDAPYKIYCPTCWWSDKWDSFQYGRDYDFSRSFFEQLNDLWHEVPLLGLSSDLISVKTSPFNHDVGHLKNCYLLFQANYCEDSAFGYYVGYSQSMFDSTAILQCQMGYDSMHSYKTNRCIGSRHQLSESIDCLFCRDCQNCQNCFASANLKNKKYYAWNQPLTKEEYFKEVSKYNLGSYKAYKEVQAKAEAHWKTQIPKSEYNEFAENCTGPNVFFSKNAKDCIEVYDAEDCRYLFRMWGPSNKNCYDISMWGDNLSLSYECGIVGENATRVLFSHEGGINLSDAQYSKLSTGGNHHFGCVSVRKGNYCILNKQYAKEEYEKLVPKIIEHMNNMSYTDVRGNIYRYGEFFPPEFSPYAYNTTLAQNFFPLTKEQALEKKYGWREPERSEYKSTIKAEELPDHIKDSADSVLRERIACINCGRAYRIIEMELAFHRQMNVPLPRECPQCRVNYKLNLWVKSNRRIPRVCAGCGRDMESPYTKEEVAEVFCRECYLQEVV